MFHPYQFGFEKHIKVSFDQKYSCIELLQSHGMSRGFHKTANEFPESILERMSEIKPHPKKIYVVIAPLGCEEYWGPNVNGDGFPDAGLRNDGKDFGHKTFEHFANMFRHHINKDPNKGFGKIIHATMDDNMGRVIVISEVDRDLASEHGAQEFIDDLDNDVLPDVSMGCKVPYDRCSICDHKAKSPAFYCEHLRYPNMLKMDSETGKIAYAINDYPKFFDLSFVHRGADRSSGTLMKIASDYTYSNKKKFFMPSGLQALVDAEVNYPEKTAEEESVEVMIKMAEASQDDFHIFLQQNPWMVERENKLPSGFLDKLAMSSVEEIFPTLWSKGMPLRPDEVQYIFMNKVGHQKIAKRMYDNNLMLPIPEHSDDLEVTYKFSPRVDKLAEAFYEKRTLRQPHFLERVSKSKEKIASRLDDAEAMGVSAKMTALYALLSSLAKTNSKHAIMNTLSKNPGFWALMGSGNLAAAQLGSSLNISPVDIRDSFQGLDKFSSDKKQVLFDFIKNASRENIAQKILGTPAELGVASLIGSGLHGFFSSKKNDLEESKKYPNHPGIDPVSQFMVEHPMFTTAAFLTVATPAGRHIAKKIIEKAAGESFSSVCDNINFVELLPTEEKDNEKYLNELSLQIMRSF